MEVPHYPGRIHDDFRVGRLDPAALRQDLRLTVSVHVLHLQHEEAVDEGPVHLRGPSILRPDVRRGDEHALGVHLDVVRTDTVKEAKTGFTECLQPNSDSLPIIFSIFASYSCTNIRKSDN